MTGEVHCTIDGCDWKCEGMRDTSQGHQRLSELLGVSATFFINAWMMPEGQRIEDEISGHLKGHTMLEALTTIAQLNCDVYNLKNEVEELRV